MQTTSRDLFLLFGDEIIAMELFPSFVLIALA